ncbi:MAG: hypothetical protein KAW12_14500 [Candidatus Aminicenantes bacterium]|nr:hypothetical protein [Candidatus Aminicenantes bacterium]
MSEKLEPKNYLFLFADLIGSTEVATEQTPQFFAGNYISSFRWAVESARNFLKERNVWEESSDISLNFKDRIEDIDITGDEVKSFASLDDKTEEKKEDIIASAVMFAYLTKLYWFISPYNLERLTGKQFPRDMAVGIHIGPASKFALSNKWDDIAGLHIHVAKRIETLARECHNSRICASEDVADMFNKWCERFSGSELKEKAPLHFTTFREQDKRHLVKGIPKSIKLYELDWDIENNDAMKYLEMLLETPEHVDMEAEGVLKKIGSNFFSKVKVGEDKFELNKAVKYKFNEDKLTKKSYIKKWFDVVNEQPKLFLDQLFLAVSYFILSCSLIRTSKIYEDQTYNDKCRKVTQEFYSSIDRLHKQQVKEKDAKSLTDCPRIQTHQKKCQKFSIQGEKSRIKR